MLWPFCDWIWVDVLPDQSSRSYNRRVELCCRIEVVQSVVNRGKAIQTGQISLAAKRVVLAREQPSWQGNQDPWSCPWIYLAMGMKGGAVEGWKICKRGCSTLGARAVDVHIHSMSSVKPTTYSCFCFTCFVKSLGYVPDSKPCLFQELQRFATDGLARQVFVQTKKARGGGYSKRCTWFPLLCSKLFAEAES